MQGIDSNPGEERGAFESGISRRRNARHFVCIDCNAGYSGQVSKTRRWNVDYEAGEIAVWCAVPTRERVRSEGVLIGMHVENRMSTIGVDCDSLASSKPRSPMRPLSESLRRSASNRSIKFGDRGGESSPSRTILSPNPKPQTPPRSLFSVQPTASPSTPTLPPLPVARVKRFQARSLSFPETEIHRSKPEPSAAAVLASSGSLPSNPLEENVVASPKNDRAGAIQQDGPAIFVKSFFRSSTLSALRGRSLWSREDAIEVPESSPYSLLTGPSDKPRVSPILEIENSFAVLTKGLLDSSRNAVKAVQDKARHLVNKRFQDGGFHLDMVYITENIITMGFPGNDSGSDILGFKEVNYRDNIDELVTFCETQHPDKYKIFNLCSEKLYDSSLLHDKVARFPFESNGCPPLQLTTAFCESACSWLKAGQENVVVVHCKKGMARTGLMISCLLLHLKFFPTAEESTSFYNQKRCVDSNALKIPSQLRYVKYYEEVLKKHRGFTPNGRRCTLRSIRLINCPSWIRPAVTVSDHGGVLFSSKKYLNTRSTLEEDHVWLSAIKSGVFLYELPDDGHAAAVDGDFKIHFQDRNVDFSCWLNTNMVGAGIIVLQVHDLDGYEKGLHEATGFQVELELGDTYLSVLNVTGTLDSTPANTRRCLPADMTTSPCATTAAAREITGFTDSEGGEEESAAGVSFEGHETRESDAGAATNQRAFQSAVSNAVTELSTGLFNAMDRFGMTHLRKSASLPNSPRMFSAQHEHHGTAWSADVEKDSTGSSRFRSSKGALRNQFTNGFDAVAGAAAAAAANTILGGTSEYCRDGLRACQSLDSGVSASRWSEEEAVNVNVPPSEFQALAAASSADASLFTFGDDEDSDSDHV